MKTNIKFAIWKGTLNWCTSTRKLFFADRWIRGVIWGKAYCGQSMSRAIENATWMVFARYDDKHGTKLTPSIVDITSYGLRWFCPKGVKEWTDEGYTWFQVMNMTGKERKEVIWKPFKPFPSNFADSCVGGDGCSDYD